MESPVCASPRVPADAGENKFGLASLTSLKYPKKDFGRSPRPRAELSTCRGWAPVSSRLFGGVPVPRYW